MYLIVANYVATELGISDRGRMLLGAIAPDAASDKASTHFKGQLHPYALNRPIDCHRFVLKYRNRFSDAFFIGYLTHLVMDDVWTMKTDFSGFEARVKRNPELYHMYHEDLRLCNAKLSQVYPLHEIHKTLLTAQDMPDIEEVKTREVLTYKQKAIADFDYPPQHLTQPLHLFTFEEMIHYVERSKSKALDWSRVVYDT
jgi:hypothetical protein